MCGMLEKWAKFQLQKNFEELSMPISLLAVSFCSRLTAQQKVIAGLGVWTGDKAQLSCLWIALHISVNNSWFHCHFIAVVKGGWLGLNKCRLICQERCFNLGCLCIMINNVLLSLSPQRECGSSWREHNSLLPVTFYNCGSPFLGSLFVWCWHRNKIHQTCKMWMVMCIDPFFYNRKRRDR